jgi:hypothetical protein
LVEDLKDIPENYDKDVVSYVNQDRISHPKLYQLPLPPFAWSIGTINQRVETIMHLAMNTQKAGCLQVGIAMGIVYEKRN